MTQMTNQKNTELIDDFDLVWIKNPQFHEKVWKMEAICLKTALKIVFWRPPSGTKTQKKFLLIFVKNFRQGRCKDAKI